MPPSDRLDLLLVSMPFGPLRQPSLGLSLLKALLAERRVEIRYLNLDYARQIGPRLYSEVSGGRFSQECQVGEWILSAALDDGDGEDDAAAAFLEEVVEPACQGPLPDGLRRELLALRRGAGRTVDRWAQQITARAPRIVGFTSVFQQHLGSLALARRLATAMPESFVLFGGANCEGAMGRQTVESFPFVHAAVSGEAEEVMPTLVEKVLGGEPVDDLPGVYTAANLDRLDRHHPPDAPRLFDLDRLPLPDYGDFFEQWAEGPGAVLGGGSGAETAAAPPPAEPAPRGLKPRLLFETSRGCWWGAKKHCTFCGLNGTSMTFRSKSATRALDELSHLAHRHPGRPVLVVDNILDMRYFRDFVPALAASDLDLDLFYEVKANLTKQQLRSLAAAGIREIQPGIESFSDAVLSLMGKGVTGLQNVQLLKWCRQLGVWPSWHLLWGFPSEPEEEYRRMAEWLPQLFHLPPPAAAVPIQLHRFSPNFERAEELGFAAVEPAAAYRHVYPGLDEEARTHLAYYFDYRHRDGRDVTAYTARLAQQVEHWRQAFDGSALYAVEAGEELLIWDLRPTAGRPMSRLAGAGRDLYQACDAVRSVSWLCRHGTRQGLTRQQTEDLVGPLVADGLMLRDGERLLSLAVSSAPLPGGSHRAAAPAEERPSTAPAVTVLRP